MTKKFLTVEADGSYPEVLGYGTDEFINSSAGAGDAGKPIALNASGLIDSSMVDASSVAHDGTDGAAASVIHTSFPLLDGTRDYTGIQSYATDPTFTDSKQLITKKYVDDQALNYDWLISADTRAATPPGTPATNYRVMVIATATGDFAGHEDDIAHYDGSSWDFTTPASGNSIIVKDVPGSQFTFDGAAWIEQNFESTTVGDGLQIAGNEISIDPTLAGSGLGYSSGIMSVNVDDSSVEIDTDTLRVKALGITDAMLAGSISDGKLTSDYIQTSEVDGNSIEFGAGSLNVMLDGINDTHIDFGLGANQVNAGDILVADAGSYTDEVNVEGALQEVYGLLEESGVKTTSGGVSKGDLLYISANDTVSTYSTITTFHKAIGLATATVGAGSEVTSLANDTILEAVIAGATAGETYYWDGTGLVDSMPSGAGTHVIQCGVALNATDLYVEVRTIKKNI